MGSVIGPAGHAFFVAATRAFIAAMKRDETNRMFINRLMDIVA